MGPDSAYQGRGDLSSRLGIRDASLCCAALDVRRGARAILLAALATVPLACSFNSDPAVHPPRGQAMPPPAALTTPPAPASAPSVVARAGDAARTGGQNAPQGRPAR